MTSYRRRGVFPVLLLDLLVLAPLLGAPGAVARRGRRRARRGRRRRGPRTGLRLHITIQLFVLF